MTEPRRDHDRPAVVYGVVRFAPGGSRQVADVVITFVSASAADDFAAEQGWPEYEVAPVRFFVHERQSAVAEVSPPIRPAASPASSPAAPGQSPTGAGPGEPAVAADRRPWTGDPALPKQGHRAAADPAGPPGSAAPSLAGQAETAAAGTQHASAAQAGDREEAGLVSVEPWGLDRWAVALCAGSDPVEAFRAVGRLPAGLVLTAAYGDVDVVLVYGRVPDGDAPPDRPPTVVETALAAEPAEVATARWMTAGEREAFRAGYAAAVDGVRRALG
ncbi:hypothetical protein ND748_15670 [Frankia sp. AiPs1]|uniref:hypothetical protein n=1 Tax=Frankia sp. AiPs1 TaxID=573493 RepID=UPI002042BF76|nr:hypothetical protein [Frankia sp. AiPs1]MCM3923096.1 hypothetical protein [Frankia sp. AiPs1]